MSKKFKKPLATAVAAAMAASVFIAPAQAKDWKAYRAAYNADGTLKSVNVATVSDPSNLISTDAEKYFIWDNSMNPAPTAAPVEEPTVIKSWKFDFGNEADVVPGYTYVAPDTNYTANTSGADQYGFIGADPQDYKLGDRLDGFATQKGQAITLTEGGGAGLYDGVGSTGQDAYGNAGDKYYPVRFALKVADETYYRVRATVTTLDPSKDAVASLYTERKHPIFTEETISAGESVTKEFTIRVTPIYYEKSEPKGTIKDEMVNVCVLGTNSALAAIEIDQIETAPVLWVLGDSTVTDGNCLLPFSPLQNYTGVGTGLTKYLPSHIAMVNEGEGGLAANDNYHFNMVKNRIKAGDYMYVEYGHNHKSDGASGYVGHLDKYYQVCKSAGATLIIVGPIDRHNTYDASTNTWLTSLAQFSRAGKGYVDSMMYGGEAAASAYVSTYQSSGEAAALSYRDGIVDEANGVRAVENIAFVDLNRPSLDWFATVSASGSIGGQTLTNSSELVDYYFQTGRGGSTDGTHPNDTGAQNLAYLFYTTADTDAYPALEPLMRNFKSGQTHYYPTPVEQAAMDAGNKAGQGNVGWPQYVVPTDNEYPVAIKSITFNENGVIESARVVVQDAKFSMSAYGIIVITVKDEDGEEIGKLYAVDQVDNSTGNGEQTIVNFSGSAVLPADGSYTAQVWQALDTAGGLVVDPENVAYSAVYTPTDIIAYLLPGDTDDVETFDYYGKESLDGAGSWTSGGSAGRILTLGEDGDVTYAKVAVSTTGNSYFVMRPFENLAGGTGSSGKYMLQVDLRYNSGANVTFGFSKTIKSSSPFVENGFDLFTIGNNGSLTASGTEIGTVLPTWTTVKYILDMDLGVATVSVGSNAAKEISIPMYDTTSVPSIDTFNNFYISGGKGASFDIDMANLVAAKLKQNKLAQKTLTVAVNNTDMGSAEIVGEGASYTAAMNTVTTVKAIANTGYEFESWTDGNNNLYSYLPELSVRMHNDLSLTANFKQAELDPITYAYKEDFTTLTTSTLAANGWVSPNAQGYVTVESDADHGSYLRMKLPSGNDRNVKGTFPAAARLSEDYIMEFDMALGYGNDHASDMVVFDSSCSVANNSHVGSNYILKMNNGAKYSTTWTINGGANTVVLTNDAWYHYYLLVSPQNKTVDITITTPEGTSVYSGTETVNGTGIPGGINMLQGRYTGSSSLDNIKIYTADQIQ